MPSRDALLVTWERSSTAPRISTAGHPGEVQPETGIRCLWTAGFIANRRELAPAGAEDRALLEQLYNRSPDAAPRRLAGPFSWILWDGRRQELVAAVDRTGQHPLYVATDADRLLLATRLELLLAAVPRRRRFNLRSLAAHAAGKAPRPGDTFYEGIEAVAPGGLLRAGRHGWRRERYWQLEPQPTLRLKSDPEYAEQCRNLLFQVAAEYAPAEPSAITLSSGMDSTSLAAALCSAAPATPLTAFVWSMPELPSADETAPATAVARFLELPLVTLKADHWWPMCSPEGPAISIESPDCNFFAEVWTETLPLARERGWRVIFTGAGGDHLFGSDVFGYPDLLLTGQWRELVRQLRRHLPYSSYSLPGILRMMLLGPIVRSYFPWLRPPRGSEVPWLKTGDLLQGLDDAPPAAERYQLLPGRLQRLQLLRDPIVPPTAEWMARHAAGHGIELRQPLMDHRLFEFAASLPTAQTFRAAERKIILRNAMRGRLPDLVLDMREKIIPSALADRGAEREQQKVRDLMTNMRAAELGLVDERLLQHSFQAYRNGERESAAFWNTLCVEAWLRRYF
jgi:asparagine synthase (glutamine-hydrolysing)